jgi:hypothetical protein
MSTLSTSPNLFAVNGDFVKAGVERYLSTVSLKDEVKQELQRLLSTHTLYDLYATEWDFNLSAYEGGRDFINETNLHKHPREHAEDYQARLKRAHYHNYCERLVDFFTEFIFAETIDRNGGNQAAFFDEFIKDVNKKGENIESFGKQVCSDFQIFGMVYVLVDAPPKDPTVVQTKLDEKLAGLRPYWVLIRPTEILDWATDEFDKFQYIKRIQPLEVFQGNVKRKLVRFTEWLPEVIQVTDVDITDEKNPKIIKAAPITNELKAIPIEVARYKRSKRNKFMGNAFLRDLALNNLDVFNITSLEQEFLYKQCFNVLAMEKDANLTIGESTDGEWGVSNVIYFPQGGKPPQYITPSAEPAKYMMENRVNCVNEMYKRAAQDMVNELFNGHKSSGYSKAMSFSTTIPQIASRAETLENLEIRLMQWTMKYMNQEWDGKIKYKDRYEVTNVTDAIAQLTMLFKDCQMPSETFVKEELKRLIHEYDGKLPSEVLDKIHKEIDAMDYEEWTDTQKLAYVGRAAMAPEAELAFGQPQSAAGGNTTRNQPPKASTPTRPTSSTSEVQAESQKKPNPASKKR